MNTVILKDKNYQREIRAFLTHWKAQKEEQTDVAKWWDDAKRKIKQITIKHCVIKNRNRDKLERELLQKLTIHKRQVTPQRQETAKLEQELQDIAEAKTWGGQNSKPR